MTSGRRSKQRRAQRGGWVIDVWRVLGGIINGTLSSDAETVAALMLAASGELRTLPRLEPDEVLTAIRELHREGRLDVGDDGRAFRTRPARGPFGMVRVPLDPAGGEPWPAAPAVSGRPCCDHCNNLAGDPAGHDYGDEAAHDGPCPECSMDEYLSAEARRSGEE